jgi:hypothetical protein
LSQEVGQLAAAMTQVKLCPYDEEEPAIWFRRIDAQYATVSIRKSLNTPMLLPTCQSKSFGTF